MMANSNGNVWEIPPIGGTQISVDTQKIIKETPKPDVAMFDNAPNDVSIGSFFWRIFLAIIVWVCVAALLFGTFALWWLGSSDAWNLNSMLWILLPVMWFVACFVWNIALAWLYNLFFSKRYYNFSKMVGLIFVSSLLILPLFIIISAIYKHVFHADMDTLYFILKLQIIFSLFVSVNLIDFLSQPNYSASSLMWNIMWLALATIVALLISWNTILITVSAIATYTCMVIWSVIWDAVYYKFYERGNNPFYLPSLNELREERKKEEVKKKEEEEEVNVDIK